MFQWRHVADGHLESGAKVLPKATRRREKRFDTILQTSILCHRGHLQLKFSKELKISRGIRQALYIYMLLRASVLLLYHHNYKF